MSWCIMGYYTKDFLNYFGRWNYGIFGIDFILKVVLSQFHTNAVHCDLFFPHSLFYCHLLYAPKKIFPLVTSFCVVNTPGPFRLLVKLKTVWDIKVKSDRLNFGSVHSYLWVWRLRLHNTKITRGIGLFVLPYATLILWLSMIKCDLISNKCTSH